MTDNKGTEPTPGISRVRTDEATHAQRLLRVDQIYSRRDRRVHYVRTAKANARPDRAGKTALIVRRVTTKKGCVDRIEVDIQSLHLTKLMQDFYKNVEGTTLNQTPAMRLTLQLADAQLFFHARDHLAAAIEGETQKQEPSQALIDDTGTALRFIAEDYGDTLQDMASLTQEGEITFGLLWTLFPPREVVLMQSYGELGASQAFNLRKAEYGEDQEGVFMTLTGDIIQYDGERFGRAAVAVKIDSFQGSKKITDLPGFPLRCHAQASSLREELIERGKKYISYIKQPVYKEYTARMAVKLASAPSGLQTTSSAANAAIWARLDKQTEEPAVKVEAHGRVMIDPTAFSYYGQMNGLCKPNVARDKAITGYDKLADDHYLVCASWINGFCFAMKLWACFDVGQFADEMHWDEDAFSNLALAENQRRIVHGLVKAHRSDDAGFDDFIRNKGKGMVGLLSGGPGVGKTSTAEAVAEVQHRPLYQVSGGELGMEPDKVDGRLEVILEITRRWSAVLLIDEADVFLAKRGKTVAQDTLVSIFLRRVEYFQGVLILTTNRGEEIDYAFQSRIHFRLHYPELDEEKRVHVWKLFIAKRDDVVDITEADIMALAKRELNGRQIKNAAACIVSLARSDQKRMNMADIVDLLDVIYPDGAGNPSVSL